MQSHRHKIRLSFRLNICINKFNWQTLHWCLFRLHEGRVCQLNCNQDKRSKGTDPPFSSAGTEAWKGVLSYGGKTQMPTDWQCHTGDTVWNSGKWAEKHTCNYTTFACSATKENEMVLFINSIFGLAFQQLCAIREQLCFSIGGLLKVGGIKTSILCERCLW